MYYNAEGYVSSRFAYGRWWSTASLSDAWSHFLTTLRDNVSPQDGYLRGFGFAIRCVVREGRGLYQQQELFFPPNLNILWKFRRLN